MLCCFALNLMKAAWPLSNCSDYGTNSVFLHHDKNFWMLEKNSLLCALDKVNATLHILLVVKFWLDGNHIRRKYSILCQAQLLDFSSDIYKISILVLDYDYIMDQKWHNRHPD